MGVYEVMEEQNEFALSILLKKEVLTTCRFHSDEIYDGGNDIKEAYKYANYLFSNHPDEVPFTDRKEMADTIQSVHISYCCEMCPSCSSHMND